MPVRPPSHRTVKWIVRKVQDATLQLVHATVTVKAPTTEHMGQRDTVSEDVLIKLTVLKTAT